MKLSWVRPEATMVAEVVNSRGFADPSAQEG